MDSRPAKRPRFASVAASSSRKVGIAAILSVVALSPGARAQAIPGTGLGAASGLGGGAATGLGTAAAPVAAPRTIWSFLGLSSSNIHACRDKLCASQLGQMLNSMATGPVAGVSGGFIPPLCPPAPNASQIAALENKPNGAAEAAAAKIKASEADAKARVAAVEYLGTVDCNRFPEARKGLISALRDDPNECVRFAAAKALNSGCCCDQSVIEALKESVAGVITKSPAETSPRVKAAAFAALQNCLMKVPEEVAAPVEPAPARPEGLPDALPDTRRRARPEGTTSNTADPSTRVTSLEAAPTARNKGDEVDRKPFGQTVAEARRTLFEVARNPQPPSTLPSGKRSVYHALVKARQDMDARARQLQNQPQPQPYRDPGVVPSSYQVPSTDPASRRDPSPDPTQPPAAQD